ncbi:MAG TPA: CinA family protein [Sphingomonas sp.]|jgi:nicotinamide-nucleotide amidase|nr:CinA family protein [Sphingomonas sp.]
MSEPIDTLLPKELIEAGRRAIDANRAAGRTIAVAESCTGGLISAALTELPGSSDVFLAGFVTYADDAKTQIGVGRDIVETFGAVSIATGWAMAQAALKESGADIVVAVTGIAGPAGGSDKKPVGTVVLARALKGQDPDDMHADKHQFGDLGRGGVRLQAALKALELLLP